jgi:hypothetical protein
MRRGEERKKKGATPRTFDISSDNFWPVEKAGDKDGAKHGTHDICAYFS